MARILKVCAKTVDRFTATLEEDGKETADYEGYVPKFFPEDHYGDYVELDIDIDTGMIVNWKKPTKKELKQLDTNT
jgi:hypothetical protein